MAPPNYTATENMLRQVLIGSAVLVAASGCTADPPSSDAVGRTAEPSFILDVVYGHTSGLAMTLDVHVPVQPNGAGVILINSGGWESPIDEFKVQDADGLRFATDEEMTESRTWHILNPRRLVEAGFTVFEVRHGTEAKFDLPEIVDHVRQAVRFVKRHASGHGVDPERLGLWGGSASGHLSLLAGLHPEGPLQDTTASFGLSSAEVQAIVAFASPTDLGMWVGGDPSLPDRYGVLNLTDEEYRAFSPTSYATRDDPPTLILHGNEDTEVPIAQGHEMFAALQDAGAPSEFLEFDSTSHDPTIEQAYRGVSEALRWFETHLLKPHP